MFTGGGSRFYFNFCPKTTKETFKFVFHVFYFLEDFFGWIELSEGLPPRNGPNHNGKLSFRQLSAVKI